jgi:hypothetical protein
MIPKARRQLLLIPIGCDTSLSTTQGTTIPRFLSLASLHSTHARPGRTDSPPPSTSHQRIRQSPPNTLHYLPRAAFPLCHPRHGPLERTSRPARTLPGQSTHLESTSQGWTYRLWSVVPTQETEHWTAVALWLSLPTTYLAGTIRPLPGLDIQSH